MTIKRSLCLHVGALLITLSFSRCTSDDSVNSVHLYTAPPIAHGPINSENPYDSVGIIHNLRCEYTLAYVTDSDTTISQI